MCGYAITTMAFAIASLIARYTAGDPDASSALRLVAQSVPATLPASRASPNASAPVINSVRNKRFRPRATSARMSRTRAQTTC